MKITLTSFDLFILCLQRILVDNEALPAGRVQPTDGELIWMLDQAAAAHIKQ
jgi:hypothetical protein